MKSDQLPLPVEPAPTTPPYSVPAAALALQAFPYWFDAWQRSVLYLDTLRQRGTNTLAHEVAGKPPVLAFDYEIIVDGRELPEPVNYALLRITPPADCEIDDDKRPFVVMDPRAGHGPGIGGFKIDSEVGVALRAGHPCYFVSFFPDPCPGQTIELVGRTEVVFLQRVNQLHPNAPGKPFVIGNCQAGWALMMLAATAPDLVGPILLAGSPLSYWSGVEGSYPMRYAGGLSGGTWTASLIGDLGNGKFDGANLVSNFEQLDPGITLWKKWYQLYSKIDTEPDRFLAFEEWWGGHYMMNRVEMDWITQNLFVGNKLTAGEVRSADGKISVDLRRIRTPIVVFASWGDNITPPQQALNWIPDLYADVDEIRAHEQVIVYCLHASTGHLGIFVSGKVASREHTKLISGLDLIDMLPPGLYEAKIDDTSPETPQLELVDGRYLLTLEPRTIDDVLALDDGRDDEQAFRVVKRVAEINQSLYDTFMSPAVKLMSNEWSARMLRALHPERFGRFLLSDLNPVMAGVKMMAEWTRVMRQPVADDNPLRTLERDVAARIAGKLDDYRDARDAIYERTFKALYASPWMAAAVGLSGEPVAPGPSKQDQALRDEFKRLKIETMQAAFENGSALDGWVRLMIYQKWDEKSIDERPFHFVRRMLAEHNDPERLTLAQLKQVLKQQTFLMLLDTDRAVRALPGLLPKQEQRRAAIAAARKVVVTRGPLSDAQKARFAELEELLAIAAKPAQRRAPATQRVSTKTVAR